MHCLLTGDILHSSCVDFNYQLCGFDAKEKSAMVMHYLVFLCREVRRIQVKRGIKVNKEFLEVSVCVVGLCNARG